MDSKRANHELRVIELWDRIAQEMKRISIAINDAEEQMGDEDVSVFLEDSQAMLFKLSLEMQQFNRRKEKQRQAARRIVNGDEGIVDYLER